MSKRCYAGLLTAIFLFSIMAPCALMLSGPVKSISDSEKRKLATLPQFIFSTSYFLDFPKVFEKYLQDNFGLRDQFIIVYNALFVKLFNSSPRADVILGKDNWLFLQRDRVLDDFMGLRLKTGMELERIKNTLESRQIWLAEINIRYLFIPIPNKITVYPEKLPFLYQRSGGEAVYSQITEYLSRHSPALNLVTLLPVFLKEKQKNQLYYKNDTHWNEYGAYIAYREIINRLTAWFPDLAPIPLSEFQVGTRVYQGDLSQFLHLETLWAEETPSLQLRDVCGGGYDRVEGYVQKNLPYQKFKAGEIDRGGCPKKKLKAIIIHDSFGGYLRNLLSQHFREAFFVTQAQFEDMRVLIEQESPDVVIDMRVARYLDSALKPHVEIERQVAGKYFEQAAGVILDYNPATAGGQQPLTLNIAAKRKNGLSVFSAINTDPQLVFPLSEHEHKGTYIAHVSLHSPVKSKLQLFFQDGGKQGFSEKQMVSYPIVKGANEIFFKIPAQTLSGALRLDPTAQKGPFALQRFTVKSMRMQGW